MIATEKVIVGIIGAGTSGSSFDCGTMDTTDDYDYVEVFPQTDMYVAFRNEIQQCWNDFEWIADAVGKKCKKPFCAEDAIIEYKINFSGINISYKPVMNRKMIHSKSGFIGRTLKRRKNIL